MNKMSWYGAKMILPSAFSCLFITIRNHFWTLNNMVKFKSNILMGRHSGSQFVTAIFEKGIPKIQESQIMNSELRDSAHPKYQSFLGIVLISCASFHHQFSLAGKMSSFSLSNIATTMASNSPPAFYLREG